MKVLTLHQPWAALVAHGIKTVETRGWSTRHRGPLAIHAAVKPCPDGTTVGDYRVMRDSDDVRLQYLLRWPEGASFDPSEPWRWTGGHGAILATATLVDVIPTEAITWVPDDGIAGPGTWGVGQDCAVIEEQERPLGDYSPGRYAWLLADVAWLEEPVPFRGGQGLTRSWTP